MAFDRILKIALIILVTTIVISMICLRVNDLLQPVGVDDLPTIHEDEIETGDLLLFNTQMAMHKFLKVATGTRVVHVAIAYRDAEGTLFIWETARVSGTTLVPMSYWLKFHQENILVRKLCYPPGRDIDMMLLQDLIQKWENQPFSFRFVRAWLGSILYHPHRNSESKYRNPSEVRPRFCSEHVAEAFEFLGVLDFKQSSCHVKPLDLMPHDYSDDSSLKLPLVWPYHFESNRILAWN